MSDIKFTTDGRKVKIIGKLNAAEYIVQEIFCTKDGAEIPSGENFVVKSLHDAPAESWKEQSLRELDARYDSMRKKLEAAIDRDGAALRSHQELLKKLIRATRQTREEWNDEPFAQLEKFLSGEFTYFVVPKRYRPEIRTFDEVMAYCDRYPSDTELRLLSLFGREGVLRWQVSQYPDGSGSSWTEVIPCTSFDEAKDCLDTLICDWAAEKGADKEMIATKAKYNLVNPCGKPLREYYKKLSEAAEANREKAADTLKAATEAASQAHQQAESAEAIA